MLYLALIILLIWLAVFVFMHQAKFGKLPAGEDLERIKRSPHYQKGKFQNIHFTPDLTDNASFFTVFRDFFFYKSKRNKPRGPLPSKTISLKNLDSEQNLLVWFGHSSYFLQADGKRFLTDPVFSGYASPIQFTTPSFKGTDVYRAEDMPEIDILFISHDHWDHLDYQTILQLKPKIKRVICGLGVGCHFAHWGFDKQIIHETDWNESLNIGEGFDVFTTSARHFSGRGFARNKSLWLSFVLRTPHFRIFLGGDSGFDTHFESIGRDFGPFDLAILECGQYNKYWKHIHMFPEEGVRAAKQLQAKRLFPVHWSKFSLALHSWDDPIIRVCAEGARQELEVIHPMIGEPFFLDRSGSFPCWWEGID